MLAVSRGSAEPPKFIILRIPALERKARDGVPFHALIGKGVTFDSGGISIKPAEKMERMKGDMAGGAAVLGAMMVLAQLRPRHRVVGLIPVVENLPSGGATRPGDVVRSFSGKTVEIINTDAEGRLILADALAYARTLGVTHLVDIATLTGACWLRWEWSMQALWEPIKRPSTGCERISPCRAKTLAAAARRRVPATDPQ